MATIYDDEENARYAARMAARAAGDYDAERTIHLSRNVGPSLAYFEAVAKYVPDSPQASWAAAAKANAKPQLAPVYIPTPAPAAAASKPVSTYTPSPAVRAAVSAPAAKSPHTADDVTAITTKANTLGLGALGAKLVARGVSYADAIELLTAAAGAGGGAVAQTGAGAGTGRAHAPAAPAPAAAAAGGGDIYTARHNEAVAAARAFAQSRGIGRSAQR